VRFKVNEPDVVYELFDEEAVIVNLETGTYYSARGGGPAIWAALANGVEFETVERAYANADGDVEALRRFVEELKSEKLLAPADGEGVAPADAGFSGDATEPTLERYADMQDLLMLDPVHDVDPKGWPVAKEG
jgi:hypothetical protein